MKTAALPVSAARRHQVTTLDQLAAIPEEEIWLASQNSTRPRRAYRLDAAHFMRSFGITNSDMLRQVDHRAVTAWERMLREQEGAAAKRRGVSFGRPQKLRPDQKVLALSLVQEGRSISEVARTFNVHPATIHRCLNEPRAAKTAL